MKLSIMYIKEWKTMEREKEREREIAFIDNM